MVLKVDTSLIAERKGDTVIVSCNGGDVDVRGPSHTSLFDFSRCPGQVPRSWYGSVVRSRFVAVWCLEIGYDRSFVCLLACLLAGDLPRRALVLDSVETLTVCT